MKKKTLLIVFILGLVLAAGVIKLMTVATSSSSPDASGTTAETDSAPNRASGQATLAEQSNALTVSTQLNANTNKTRDTLSDIEKSKRDDQGVLD